MPTTLELTRLGLVYLHLLAACVAIGLILKSDAEVTWDLAKHLNGHAHIAGIERLMWIIAGSLAVLWFTGLSIIGLDLFDAGWDLHYLDNPKLQAKVLVAVGLTSNGFLLHSKVLPYLIDAGCLTKLRAGEGAVACLAGSTSLVSWLYAAFLGVGRVLSWKVPLAVLLFPAPILILAGSLFMYWLIQRGKEGK